MSYPASLPTYTDADPNDTLDFANHTFRHNQVQRDIIEIAKRVGITASTDATSHDKRIANLEANPGGLTELEVQGLIDASLSNIGSVSIVSKETPSGAINGSNASFTTSQPYIGGSLQVYVNGLAQGSFITESSPTTGVFTLDIAPKTGDNVSVSYQFATSGTNNADTVDGYHLGAIMESIYPVGAVYISGSSTLPALISAIGTWVRVEGKFIVGASDSDGDFDNDDTGGSKTHSHSLNDSAYAQISIESGTIFSRRVAGTTSYNHTSTNTGAANSSGTRTLGHALGGVTVSASTLPPYKAKYMWERTI